jgi:hypothetical protein
LNDGSGDEVRNRGLAALNYPSNKVGVARSRQKRTDGASGVNDLLSRPIDQNNRLSPVMDSEHPLCLLAKSPELSRLQMLRGPQRFEGCCAGFKVAIHRKRQSACGLHEILHLDVATFLEKQDYYDADED